MIIEIYTDKIGEFRWRMRSKNNRIVASSAGDGYKHRRDVLNIVMPIIHHQEPWGLNDVSEKGVKKNVKQDEVSKRKANQSGAKHSQENVATGEHARSGNAKGRKARGRKSAGR